MPKTPNKTVVKNERALIFMTKLILHVGPAKCGSSSIQYFFATNSKPCLENTHYVQLNPLDINELNCKEPKKTLLDSFTEYLSEILVGCDALILSHEYLFQTPQAVKNICYLAKNLVGEITIIGYSRRQSDFLISQYSQWLFRSPERIDEINKELANLKLDAVLFAGLERQIIASIANDFLSARMLSEYSIHDWKEAYNNILELVLETGAVIKCGVLPSKKSDTPLIQDFCKKSGLSLQQNLKSTTHQQVSNPSYAHDVVEAINNAVALGADMPGPHEKNGIMGLLSSRISQQPQKTPEFLNNLKSYIDSYYWESNKSFCKQFDLDERYFSVQKSFSKSEILDVILHEEQQRSSNKSAIINNYRMLSARLIELCIELAEGK